MAASLTVFIRMLVRALKCSSLMRWNVEMRPISCLNFSSGSETDTQACQLNLSQWRICYSSENTHFVMTRTANTLRQLVHHFPYIHTSHTMHTVCGHVNDWNNHTTFTGHQTKTEDNNLRFLTRPTPSEGQDHQYWHESVDSQVKLRWCKVSKTSSEQPPRKSQC